MTHDKTGNKPFEEMASDEKREFRFAAWKSIETRKFATAETATAYQARVQRLIDVFNLQEPDEVPAMLMRGSYVAKFGGISQADTYYASEKNCQAAIKFMEEFTPDYAFGAMPACGPIFDLLGYNTYKWPGGTLPDDASFQYVEGEYMPAHDYDELIADPSGYIMRRYMPRVFDNLQGLAGMPNFYKSLQMSEVLGMLMPLTNPEVRNAFDRLLQAADMLKAEMKITSQTNKSLIEKWGTPGFLGGIAFAPFDIIGDTLRGTQGVMMDIYRRPEKLLAACEAVVPAAIDMAVANKPPGSTPIVFIPLHKGADGFMSREQFMQFYWPTFRKQLDGIIAAGMVPLSFVEGSYNDRLDLIAEAGLPRGRTAWLFDKTDMLAAREILGGQACIAGNVPSSLFATGTPEAMDACCKHLIEDVGKGGGYILTSGSPVDHTTPENVHTFLRSVKKYGR
jgi:uroporphyrinogen-III decarboxylase